MKTLKDYLEENGGGEATERVVKRARTLGDRSKMTNTLADRQNYTKTIDDRPTELNDSADLTKLRELAGLPLKEGPMSQSPAKGLFNYLLTIKDLAKAGGTSEQMEDMIMELPDLFNETNQGTVDSSIQEAYEYLMTKASGDAYPGSTEEDVREALGKAINGTIDMLLPILGDEDVDREFDAASKRSMDNALGKPDYALGKRSEHDETPSSDEYR